MLLQARMEQHAQQAEMHVQLLQEANASLADERAALLQVIPDLFLLFKVGFSEGESPCGALKH